MNLSGVVLTKNSEKSLRRCLESMGFCDELVVIDDSSEDGTVRLARKLGARVYKRDIKNNWAAQRNFGLQKAKGGWVLFVDSDEVVSRKLRKEIVQFKRIDTAYSGFYIKRKDVWMEKTLDWGEWGKTRFLRLGRKGAGKWDRRVHERWCIKGEVGEFKNTILHYPHPKVEDFVDQINRYSGLHAKENKKAGKKSGLIKVVMYPLFKFLCNWIYRRGHKDGMRGLIYSVMMSFHSFLSWSKQWIKE